MFKSSLNLHKILLLVLFFLAGRNFVCAHTPECAPEADSLSQDVNVRFELLTCSPGQQVYELYGHTALRAIVEGGTDVVFNYGVFDYEKPHFVWNFVWGKTDYMVVAVPLDLFLQEYEMRGSSVTSQRLNLTPSEASCLFLRLTDNIRPANCEYRYNYLTNNCTTKVRDMIEGAIDGDVVYREEEKHTYRDCMRKYTEGHPWAETGNSLLLGASVDTILSDHTSAFLPERLMAFYEDAKVYDADGNSRPLIDGGSTFLLKARPVEVQPEFPLTPNEVSLCFAGLGLLIFFIEIVSKRMMWAYDMLLMTALGLCGILVCSMFLFSQHPSVDSNWQILLFNPLPLLCMPVVVKSAIKHEYCLYHLANLAYLILFLAFSPWIPQHFSAITIPLACTLLLRPISYYIYYSRVLPNRKTLGSEGDRKKKKTIKRKA